MAKNKNKQRKWESKYEKISELGDGGNAKVYKVKSKESNEEYALKDLVNYGRNEEEAKEKKVRFLGEINTIKANMEEVEGIIPILEYSLDEYWYTMPIAKPIFQFIKEKEWNMEKIVQVVVQLCSTLETLHKKGVTHRDIKPANIYYYKEKFCLGDFGLADFPENENDFTKSDRGLGAIFTIAPEMKRNPQKADAKKADVFSLAKTMWMFLTKNEKGFDGVYNYLDPSHSLRYMKEYKNEHIVEIEDLLKDATDNNPDLRPTIEEFKSRLIEWISIHKDMNKSQASEWKFLCKQLFGLNTPESSSWKNINKIVEILNVVGRIPEYNHMIFHSGGGLDFSHAKIAEEAECIKLYDILGFCHIVKPKKLYFEGFETDFRWNYFLLEFGGLNPVFKNSIQRDEEHLVEDTPAHYVSAKDVKYGVYDYETGTPLPKGFQEVYRYTKGKFLIVMKNGPYNSINGIYDGRHGEVTAQQFREYIDKLVDIYSRLYQQLKECNEAKEAKKLTDDELKRSILNTRVFNDNPFNDRKTKEKTQDSDESGYGEKYQEQQKSKEYIYQEYAKWNFSDMFQVNSETNTYAVKFAFKLVFHNSSLNVERLTKKINNYICTDGYIRKLDAHSDENCYYIYDRDKAIKFKDKLEERIIEYLKSNGLVELEKYDHCFKIELIKCGKPMHLFTKQEIEEVMRNADDRLNNQLVIDENGYVRVIQSNRIGHLFPVMHGSWNAGNGYVGRYSDLATLNDTYISSLNGWLLYLQTGREQYTDYVYKYSSEQELMDEIEKYY